MSDTDTTTTDDTTTDDAKQETTTEETDDKVTLSKAEHDALRRQAAEGQRAARRAKSDAEKRDAEKAKAEGRWEEIAKENERKAAEAEQRLQARDRADRVESAARRLKFKSPKVAIKFIDDDVDLEDDQLTEAALKKVLAEYPELKVGDQRRSGTSIRSGQGDTEVEKDPMLGIAKDLHRHLRGE
jgi:hypothetical protein